MRTFDCDFDIENNNGDVSQLRIDKQDCYVSIATFSDGDVSVVWIRTLKARELAAELIRLADEIEGVYRHDEIRGTMYCSSLMMPIKPKQ